MIKELNIFLKKENLTMAGLGFSAGLPIMLVFSTLSVWLVKAGIERSTVTLFSWAGFAYSFKFLWSPIVDKYEIPFLKNFGHRRGWLLTSQILIFISIILASYSNPQNNLKFMAVAIVLIAFFSATQDIVIDAFRIESAPEKKQGPLSSMYLAGYRIAMIVSGAGSLWLASFLGGENYQQNTWKQVYQTISLFMIIGLICTLISQEPNIKSKRKINQLSQIKFAISTILSIIIFFIVFFNFPKVSSLGYIFTFILNLIKILLSFTASLLTLYTLEKIGFLPKKQSEDIFIKPIANFFARYKKIAIIILLLIGLYRIADVVMGVMANIFYLEKGYKISEIATYSKFFGVFATILGGFIGGFCSYKFGTMKSLFFGALIAASSNLLFAWLAVSPISINFLITVITADNISSGFAGAAFVIYLSGLTSIKFTATQYALFSSIMLFVPKLIAGYAGGWVDFMGYSYFFSLTAFMGLPVLFLIIWIAKVAPVKN